MGKNFPEITREVMDGIELLQEAVPGVMAAFGALGEAASEDRALSPKTKELISLAIAVAVRCDGCVAYHAKSVLECGATRDEVAEAIGVAIHMGGGPSVVYGGAALKAFDAFVKAQA
ncbi:carboxymuconolactone decarboxylase family protein [Afifella sp. IM 167]|uniref:carboxymuconolactone decarboxylase family protein n=1 Tax=Afifella sp. IM 167 TaxID=2033586 RepID=UPI001CD03E24|nr:carboxymuconolactone decarboxylase family protein [Afifella sp. IM 167]MBZ8132978.1 carboxymuconolactone decarboxylase [Afifella sp. IM 167]